MKKLIKAPTVRTFTQWTPQLLRSAEAQADSGNLLSAASVCEWLGGDDRVSGAMETRLDALFGIPPTFIPTSRPASNKAAKALQDSVDWWSGYEEANCREIVYYGLLLGVAPARHYWQKTDESDGRLLAMPRLWHPQSVRFDYDLSQWLARDDGNVEHVITPGDGEWILHCPFGVERPWAKGLWRSLSRWVLVKHYAVQDWARHSEKNAKLVVTGGEMASEEDRAMLGEDLASIGSDAVVVMRAGFDMKLLEISANTKQIYESQIAMADLAIATRIRGANLATQVDGGSHAAAKEQSKVGTEPKLRADAQAWTTTIRNQSLRPWAKYNFGDPAAAPWPFYQLNDGEDRAARASTVSTLATGLETLDRLGYDVDEKLLKEEFGIGWLKTRDKSKTKAKPAEPDGVPEPSSEAGGDEGSIDDPPEPTDKAVENSWHRRTVMLASGDAIESARGFVDSSEFVGRVAESYADAAATELKHDMQTIVTLVEECESYEELAQRLRETYAGMDMSKLLELTQKAMILSELAGMAAVQQDL